MDAELHYDGRVLTWESLKHKFKATSGMKTETEDFQAPSHQCVKEAGPVPEGFYVLVLKEDPRPARSGSQCNLVPSRLLQRIPRGAAAGECEPYWANWGENRIRIDPADLRTRTKCSPRRSGFYLHDSTKGYSHGCIEVEGAFFTLLRSYMKTHRKQRKLYLRVHYTTTTTNGGTRLGS